MTKILLTIIITIFMSPFIMNSFLPFIHPAAKIGTVRKNLSNQQKKLNEEDCRDNIELKTIIKMLKQMKKKFAKCEKHKSHTHLIGNQSPDFWRPLEMKAWEISGPLWKVKQYKFSEIKRNKNIN